MAEMQMAINSPTILNNNLRSLFVQAGDLSLIETLIRKAAFVDSMNICGVPSDDREVLSRQ